MYAGSHIKNQRYVDAMNMLMRFAQACDVSHATSSQCKAYLGVVVVGLYAGNAAEAWAAYQVRHPVPQQAMEDEQGRCTDIACRDRRHPMTSCARFLAASGMERENQTDDRQKSMRSFAILPCYSKSLEMWMHAMLWGVIASSEAETFLTNSLETRMHGVLWGATALI